MFRKNFSLLKLSFNLYKTFVLRHRYSKLHSYNLLNIVNSLRLNITSTITRYSTESVVTRVSDYTNVESNCNSYTNRTHTCGELRPKQQGQKVTLYGWVQYSRLSKFILLRDSYGITQCILGNKTIDLNNIQLETVVKVEGMVALRPEGTNNPKMTTGEIEVVIDSLEVLNNCDSAPFNLRDYQKPKEQLRLQHRYVDLRFPEMQRNLRKRSEMLHLMRRFLVEKHGFVEVETPTLFCRTPGGAREFVVPTHYPGLFYSLVQSPQQFKQMLMSGGIDRYFQIARCYRDEATRPDRQPEFTQLDIELSFTHLDGVLTLIEDLLYETYLKDLPKPPFKRMTYNEAIENYGSDKPNLSYGLNLKNIKHLFSDRTNDENFRAYVLPYPTELGKLSAKYKEQIKNLSKKYGTLIVLNENISKQFGTDISQNIQHLIGANSSIVAVGNGKNVCLCLGELRDVIASLLIEKKITFISDEIETLWVVDFPLFEQGEKGLETCHHPFTAPHPDDLHLLDSEPLKVRSLAYDLVMNGNEVGGGSVRVHNVQLQKKLLGMLNIDTQNLGHFLNALKFGCPPHAGIALGIDRLMTIACDVESIRDVIAFPKSHEGKDPLSGAPNQITEDDKKYYNIVTVK